MNKTAKVKRQLEVVTAAVLDSAAKRETAKPLWDKFKTDPQLRGLFKNQTGVSTALNRAYKRAVPLLGRTKATKHDITGPGIRFAYTSPDIRTEGNARVDRKVKSKTALVPHRAQTLHAKRHVEDVHTFDETGTIIPRYSQPKPPELGGPQIGPRESDMEPIQITVRGSLKGRKIVIQDIDE